MKFSIIVPVYNVEDYLPKCLDSLLCQKGDFEIIAVDDGSADSSGALCDRYEAAHPDRIRVIHQKNKGLGGARNTGIEAAKGEYLLFVDSDDTVAPDTLEKLEETVEKKDPELVIFAMRSVDEAGNTLSECRENLTEGEVFAYRDKKESLFVMPNAWNKLFRADLFAKTGVRFPDRVWYEDIRTVPKILCQCERIVYLDSVLYHYLVRAGSITNNKNLSRNEEILWAFDDLREYFEKIGILEALYPEFQRLAVEHILLAATVRVTKIDRKSPLTKRFRAYMEERFPGYEKNPYLGGLTGGKKLAYRLIRGGHFGLLRLLFRIKDGK